MHNEQKIPRPPIVVIMGHIDHGKSTLLDYIRKTSLAEKEVGGITQHISAYEVEYNGRKIVFLDTQGHEAFHSTRESGSKVADIAIIVVSAEDGVKPQTMEVIGRAQKDGIPFIVAINKIDKPSANVDKTKGELAEAGILVEGWGGTIPVVLISGKTGEGVDELLETILLQGDLENFSGDPNLPASGSVLESHRDAKKGIAATLIIKNGSLKKGMFVTAGGAYAPVRFMENFKGDNLESASLSTPVSVTGWSEMPDTGIVFDSHNERITAGKSIEEAKNLEENDKSKTLLALAPKTTLKFLPMIIKSDALGSQSAVEHELQKLGNDRVAVKIISSGVGPINESDAKLAASSPEILLVGFHVGQDSAARDFCLRASIEARTFDIIYELVDWVSAILKERTPKEEVEEVTGIAKIIRVFSQNKTKQIIGGVVESGEILSNETVRIMRREAEIGQGKIKELQSSKIKVGSVSEGVEFGMMIDSKIEIVAGDKLEAYKKVSR